MVLGMFFGLLWIQMRGQGRLKQPVEHSPEYVSLDGVDSWLSPLCLSFWEGLKDSLPKFYLSLCLGKQQYLLEKRNKEAEVWAQPWLHKEGSLEWNDEISWHFPGVWVTRRRQKVVTWFMEGNRKQFTVPPSASVLQVKRVLPLKTLWSYFLLKFVRVWVSWRFLNGLWFFGTRVFPEEKRDMPGCLSYSYEVHPSQLV